MSQSRSSYLQRVLDVAQWSEEGGYKGILIYTANNAEADPWLLAQVIAQNSKLCPLVAVQPIYMHPFTVAKLVSSLSNLYGRKIFLNMVAGGSKTDLQALNDTTPHDRRYDRLIEYTSIIKALCSSSAPVSYNGEFYKLDTLRMVPAMPQDLFPGFFISGSSEAGFAAARAIGATTVRYPKPAEEDDSSLPIDLTNLGIRVGIIAREDEEHAWHVAHARFPEDRRGQITHMLAMSRSDSVWHQQLQKTSEHQVSEGRSPYWLTPFQNYKEYCPYLVGDYARVAQELARYIATGHTTFILDIPPDGEESRHINVAFKRALELVASSHAAAGAIEPILAREES
jgi:alkanesulfonate monooxygenase